MSDSPTSKRGKTANRTNAQVDTLGRTKKQPKNVKPAEIHELRLETSRIQQQTRLLKTQLNRIKDRINSKTKAINKTVANSSDQPSDKSHQNAIKQIEGSIEAAQNTLAALQIELEEARNDDRNAVVDELIEELKIAYCEYHRLLEQIDKNQTSTSDIEKKLRVADQIASSKHGKELDREISQIRDHNHELREKLIAYQKKMERNKVEATINERKKAGKSQILANKEIEDTKRYRTEKFNMIADELNKEMDDYDQKVDKLNDIIAQMRKKIIDHLCGAPEEEAENEHYEEEENFE